MWRRFFLSAQYARFYSGRSLLLIIGLALAFSLPVTTRFLAAVAANTLSERARDYPFLVGSPGSPTDLVTHALYYRNRSASELTYAAVTELKQDDLVTVLPLHLGHFSGDYPIVGAASGFLKHRNVQYQAGGTWERMGDCILGANVARNLGLSVGGSVISNQESFINPAGALPLKMRITGILAKTGSPDDEAIFVSLETAWLIDGIGHGHEESLHTESTDPDSSQHASLEARGTPFLEVTSENINQFHFHGSRDSFPMTCALAVPVDSRSGTIWEGRIRQQDQFMLVRPAEVIEGLVTTLVDMQRVIDAIATIVGMIVLMLIVVIVMLSQQMRREEFETYRALGIERAVLRQLFLGDFLMMLIPALLLSVLLTAVFVPICQTWWEQLVLS
ncbi:MAG: hypothetical protein KDA78_06245 [Planctomycetaceae bacterium]|nr:hypothetical protein [Planctomycetaceae bacterium]